MQVAEGSADTTRKVGPALAAGCSIVFKAAEQTPLSTLKFAELVKAAGYPAGVFNLVNGVGKVTGEAMARHPDIDKIAFTGSTVTGRRIAIAAAETNLKSVTLELGGKSPNIVFEKANLPEAAKWAAFGVFENMGQSCNAGSRILVQDSIYDEFLKLFVEATKAFKVGDVKDPETFQGPQVSKVQFEKILGYIEQGKKEAKLITGGSRFGDKGYFITPTVFGDVDMSMKIGQEEIFGPVASIIRFKDQEEAIKLANDTEYGLAAAVHSTDYAQVQQVVRKLKAGTVWINQVGIRLKLSSLSKSRLTRSTPSCLTRFPSVASSSPDGAASWVSRVSSPTSPPRLSTTTTARSSSGPSSSKMTRVHIEQCMHQYAGL